MLLASCSGLFRQTRYQNPIAVIPQPELRRQRAAKMAAHQIGMAGQRLANHAPIIDKARHFVISGHSPAVTLGRLVQRVGGDQSYH